MKGEKFKLILVYILVIIVIILTVALVFTVLNNAPEKQTQTNHIQNPPKVDVNPYPEISDECTFDLTLAEYNSLTGPKCKGGYSRYNITDINIENNPLNLVIIYSDKEGPKSGLYLNRAKIIKKVDNLANIGIGVFDNKLFILDKENVNVLAYNSNAENIYNLSETLNELNLKDQTTNEIITNQNINPNSFNFQNTNFSFWTNSQTVNNTTVNPVNYIVTFTGEEFNDPVPNIQNQG